MDCKILMRSHLSLCTEKKIKGIMKRGNKFRRHKRVCGKFKKVVVLYIFIIIIEEQNTSVGLEDVEQL